MRKGRTVVRSEEVLGGVREEVAVGELDVAGEAAMSICLVAKDGGRHRLQVSCASALASMRPLSQCSTTSYDVVMSREVYSVEKKFSKCDTRF